MKSVYEIENIDNLLIDLNDETFFYQPFARTINDIADYSMREAVNRVQKRTQLYTSPKKDIHSGVAVASKKSALSVRRNGYVVETLDPKNMNHSILTMKAWGYPMKLRHYDTARGDAKYTERNKINKKGSYTKKKGRRVQHDIKVAVIKRKVTKLIGRTNRVGYFRSAVEEGGAIKYRKDKVTKEKNIKTFPSLLEYQDIPNLFGELWDEKSKLRFIHHLNRKRGKFFQ